MDTKPPCFGELNKVFPMGNDGLRQSPDECLQCSWKTRCLRSAMRHDSKAAQVNEDRIDKAYDAGLLSFAQRWARKKSLNKRKRK